MPVRLGGALLAEFIGTFALVFIGTMSVAYAPAGLAGLLAIALAFGLTVAVIVSATIHTSGGHLNPAVTLGLLLTGKIKPVAAVAYIITQLIAAVAGSLAVFALVGLDLANNAVWGVTDFDPNSLTNPVSVWTAISAEVIATFILVFVIWGSVADPRARNTGGFAIGLTVTANILAIGPITGASLNPARSFGPSVVASLVGATNAGWNHHWVYWVGPIVGGVLAAVLYHLILWPRDPKRGIDPDAVDVAVTQRP